MNSGTIMFVNRSTDKFAIHAGDGGYSVFQNTLPGRELRVGMLLTGDLNSSRCGELTHQDSDTRFEVRVEALSCALHVARELVGVDPPQPRRMA